MTANRRPRFHATVVPPTAFVDRARDVRRATLALENDDGLGALVLSESYLGKPQVSMGMTKLPRRTWRLTREEAFTLGLALVDFAVRGDLSSLTDDKEADLGS